MSSKRILLVEDDLTLSKELKEQLTSEQFKIDTAYDGLVAERLMRSINYDVLLVDVNIPGKNGFEFIRDLRYNQVSTPAIIITAFGEVDDKVFGFDCGADDYLTKPFSFKELLARIKAVLKRSSEYSGSELIIAEDLIIDTRKREVKRKNKLIRLTSREYEILLMLAEAQGKPVSKNDLLNKVWGSSFSINTNTIEVFINLLRNKIDKGHEPKLIKTRIGFGYYIGKN